MAAVPPPFDPGDEPDPRGTGLPAQGAGQQPARGRRAGYLIVGVLLIVLVVAVVLLFVL
jgi:hypothetical protein